MKQSLSYLLRFTLCVLIFLIYLFAWRPVRHAITQKMVYPVLAENQSDQFSIVSDGTALRITFSADSSPQTYQYSPQGGFFFLIALLTLICITAEKRWYFVLIGFHAGAILLTYGLMMLSSGGWNTGFIFVDFVVTYLVPSISLALAAWAMAEKRRQEGFKIIHE
jgi:hypothetical protein